MKHRTLLIYVFTCMIFSCDEKNESCAGDYIGTFQIDMHDVIDSSQKRIIRQKGWDQVYLISDKSGSYHFSSRDVLLKSVEGSWRVASTGIEGGCMGYIKQNNFTEEVSGNAFSISIQIAPDRYIGLPFRKVK
jgi:hypothetical protein